MKTLNEILKAYKKLTVLDMSYQTAIEAVSEARFNPSVELAVVVSLEKDCRRVHDKLTKTLESFGLPTTDYSNHLVNDIEFAWWVMNLKPDLREAKIVHVTNLPITKGDGYEDSDSISPRDNY